MRPTGLLAAGVAALALSACVSVLPEAEKLSGLYTLVQPADFAGPAATGDGATITLGPPSAARAWSGDEIALRAADGALIFLPRARWADAAPRLLQDLLLDRLARTGARPAPASAGVAADFEVSWRVRAFEADFDTSAPQARIALDAMVMDAARTQTIPVTVFEEAPVTGDPKSAANIIAALREVARRASDRLAEEVVAATASMEGADS